MYNIDEYIGKVDYKSIMHKITLVAGNENNLNDFLKKSFNIVGNSLGVSRVYYFSYEQDRHEVNNILEWAYNNTSKEKDKLQDISFYNFDWFYRKLVAKKIIKYYDINEISDYKTKKLFIQQNIKSILVVPIYVHNEFNGFVGYGQCDYYREWNYFDQFIIYTLAIMSAQSIKEKFLKEVVMKENKQLLAIADNLQGLSYVIDRENYKIIYANEESKKLYNQNLEGKICYKVLQNKEQPCEYCTNEYIKNIGDTYEWEHHNEILKKDFYLTDRLIELPDSRIAKLVVVFDVTKFKEMEKKLFKEKELMRVTLLSIGEGIITTDSKGNISMLNKVAEELTGWSNKEAIGKPLVEVFKIVNKYTRKQCKNPVEKVLETKKIEVLDNHTILISKDLQEKDISNSAAPIKDCTGNIIGIVLAFRDVSENVKKEEEIKYLSRRDVVTGLYNRNYFEQLFTEIDIEENLSISIIMGDLNGLKMINDAFGHQEGDRLLKSMGRIIKESCRKCDVASRWGGDEFVVLLKNTSEEQAWNICERIKARCSAPGSNLSPQNISLGYATKQKIDDDIMEVLKQAEDNMYKNKLLESRSLRNSIIASIQKTLYEKSHETEEHAERLGSNCRKIGMLMNLSSKQIDELQLLAVLHDIGKIAINDNVLLKSDKLNDEEWEEIKKHPEIGYRILKSVPELSHIAEYVLFHHERWDGKGYPQRLSGNNIPLLSRIIAVVDAYDAMTNDRSYRNALSIEEANRELIKNSGKQFDPDVVNVFINKIITKYIDEK